MGGDGFRRRITPPPRTLNIEKFTEARASELEALHTIVSNRLNNNFRSRRNKRRRTTGHDNRLGKNRFQKKPKLGLFGVNSDLDSTNDSEKKVKIPRRIRRRIELQKNPEKGFLMSGDGTRRLRTHVWHAKRFTVKKIWGFYLPLGIQGRGRGSRALLKWFRNEAVVHDASYCCAVQLEGPEDSLLSILSMVLVPSPSVHSEDISAQLSGAAYGSSMLHHVGAPLSQPIAPVIYMWRPFYPKCTGIDTADCMSDGYDKPQGTEFSCFRQLWIWIHASAFCEGYDVLRSACQKQKDDTRASINCSSLEGQLGKVEVMGLKAFQLLQKILRPASYISENSCPLRKCSLEAEADSLPSMLENEEKIPSHAVISLTVSDPRDLPQKGPTNVRSGAFTDLGIDLPVDEDIGNTAIGKNLEENEGQQKSFCPKSEESGLPSNVKDLWHVNCGLSPPVDESLLCLEKHQRRLASFCVSEANSGIQNTSSSDDSNRVCPILLLRDSEPKERLSRWSIILPLGWVKAFWFPLISKGAHAIGLREKRWIACDVGLPHFPSDFADCSAYLHFMTNEAAASFQEMERRPRTMRHMRVPIPPPWDCLPHVFDKLSGKLEDPQSHCKKICGSVVNGSSTAEMDCGVTSLTQQFQGFVARTSSLLTGLLDEIRGINSVLIFPKESDRNFHSSKSEKVQGEVSRHSEEMSQVSYGQKLFFVRVLLHAHKEGVFEEGAVVCAPRLDDVILFTSSSAINEGGLQMPESCVASYFKQQPSGKWELQIPEDTVARESHRWPIGFVTNGFVRGSKKPVAVALCVATFLSRIREEQWNKMPKLRRKKTFVLVRNLRSTAYRLARATIVLEEIEEDLGYI
ncbi:LOW QUALITY PROTEIN: Pop1, N-terminal [Dillenia turbinata]|uniref:Pop1, N-terminal n=1 Tax=Dillenia turbinata TaxID=194707 RepID=A0AAN8W3L5_9MAGN